MKVHDIFKLLILNPQKFLSIAMLKYSRIVDNQELMLRILYRQYMNEELNLENPQKFTEKMQWLKLHDHNMVYHTMVDKYEVKSYVSRIIGEKYIIKTLGVWDNFDAIEFDKLPSKFVLKTTGGGGGNGVVICTDKENFDFEEAKKKLNDSANCDIYKIMGEWVYKDIKPRIIAEEFFDNGGKSLDDYKFFCFNGKPSFFFVASDRFNALNQAPIFDFYDLNCNLLDFNNIGYRSSGIKHINIPKIKEMIDISEKLSEGIPFLRVDLYVIEGKVYFGETTFYHDSGFYGFTPDGTDLMLGQMIKI